MTNQSILISAILVLILGAVGFSAYKSQNNAPSITPAPIVENPTNPPGKVTAGYVAGHVILSPLCPVEEAFKPCRSPEKVYTSREAVVYGSNGVTVRERVHLDEEGNYRIALAPGNYFVQIVPAGIGPGEKKPVTIKSFQTSVVNFDIDTGIR